MHCCVARMAECENVRRDRRPLGTYVRSSQQRDVAEIRQLAMVGKR